MVKIATSFGNSGLSDWLVQRISALILFVYTLVIVGFFIANPNFNYEQWVTFFHSTEMQIFSFLAILSFTAHAWIGIWTVVTDYIKCRVMRLSIQTLVILMLLGCLFWAIEIIWGV